MINVTKHGPLGIIEIDRPQRRNALDVEHCQGLREAMAMALADRARVVVVTGAGSSFCAGADLDEVYDVGLREALYPALNAIVDAPVPVIAAVNGPAIGAGTHLALACDLRVAAPEAVFGMPTARIGLAVDPETVRRAVVVAGGLVWSMLLACVEVSAAEALRHGLVDRLGGKQDALDWARQIADFAPLTLAYSKRALNHPDDPELSALCDACWASDDVLEGQKARAEHRPAEFRGR